MSVLVSMNADQHGMLFFGTPDLLERMNNCRHGVECDRSSHLVDVRENTRGSKNHCGKNIHCTSSSRVCMKKVFFQRRRLSDVRPSDVVCLLSASNKSLSVDRSLDPWMGSAVNHIFEPRMCKSFLYFQAVVWFPCKAARHKVFGLLSLR